MYEMDPPQPAAIPMDPQVPPTYITPAVSATVSELPPVDHLAPVADPSPAQPLTPHHPPYAEMITAAISALKERNGSSKTAIAKYIDRVYTNLPSTHSALLTHHLKRLKSSGQIVMVKKSYKLPSRSAAALSLSPVAPLHNATTTTFPTATDLTSAPHLLAQIKNRPGRPRKAKPESTPQNQDQAHAYSVGPAYTDNNFAPPVGPAQYQIPSYPVGPVDSCQNVSVGPVQVPQKKTPGRPRKNHSALPTSYVGQNTVVPPVSQCAISPPLAPNGTLSSAEAQNMTLPPAVAPIPPAADNSFNPPMVGSHHVVPPVAQGNGTISGSEAMFVSLGLSDAPPGDSTPAKRRRGRPRRYDTDEELQPRPKPVGRSGTKRKAGRPRKNGPAPGVWPVQVPMAAPVPALTPASGKPRGRPKKDAAAGFAASNGSLNGMQPKKRGRKPKHVEQTIDGGMFVPVQVSTIGGVMIQPPYSQGDNAVSDGMAPVQVPISTAFYEVPPLPAGKNRGRLDAGGPKKPRKLTGKPLGRPKKIASGGDNSSFAAQNLKSKLAYLQSRIKETVSVIKPCINPETAGDAMGALQQLEELATVDLSAPVQLNIEQQPAQQM